MRSSFLLISLSAIAVMSLTALEPAAAQTIQEVSTEAVSDSSPTTAALPPAETSAIFLTQPCPPAPLPPCSAASLSTTPSSAPPGSLPLTPRLRVSFDATAPAPSALEGPFQPRPVGPGPNQDSGLSVSGSAQLQNLGDSDHNLSVRLRGGGRTLNGELSYTNPVAPTTQGDLGFSVNLFNERAVQSAFANDDRDVFIPRGYEPWTHRTGGGAQVTYTIAADLVGALGLSYQQVTQRNRMFSDRIVSEDEFGNPLNASSTGRDDLLTLSFSGEHNRLDDRNNPRSGYRILAGVDQAVPIGDAQINFTRLSGNYIQYIPVNLIRTADRSDALILNLQAGTMFGDVPPYEAFNLGSGSTIGYGFFNFGTGTSFAQVAAEYRFPIVSFEAFSQPIALGASLFGGYVTDLGTANQVIGEPAIVRDKAGSGYGIGFGLRADTPLGLVRLELGFSDRGGSLITITTGERF